MNNFLIKPFNRFMQGGGLKLIWEYTEMGRLFDVIKMIKRKSYQKEYAILTRKVDLILES